MPTGSEDALNRIAAFMAKHLADCCSEVGTQGLTRDIEHFDSFGEVTVRCAICGSTERAAINYETAEVAKRDVDAAITDGDVDALFFRYYTSEDDLG